MATLKYLSQYFSTTLNVGGGIDDSQTTGIILQSVSGVTDITKPGQICITYSDPIDTSVAEWIDYTSINGSNELVGAVRGREGFSAHAHLQGATVAFVLSASHHNDVVDAVKKVYNETTDTLLKASAAEVTTGTDDAKIVTPLSAAPYGNSSLSRQAIINGNFDVWQRGTSFTGASPYYSADRWQAYRSGFAAGATFSRQTASLNGSQYCLRASRDSGGSGTGEIQIAYAIETNDSVKLRGKKLTLSFYARKGANFSATSDALPVSIQSGTGTDQSITTGFTGDTSIGSTTATLTTSWTKFTVTTTAVVGDTINEIGIKIYYAPTGTAGAADYFEITQVQLCAGDVALPFQPKSYTQELIDCQRYTVDMLGGSALANIIVATGECNSTTRVYSSIQFPVTMRVAPTLVAGTASNFSVGYWTGGNIALTAMSLNIATPQMVLMNFDVAAGLTANYPARIFRPGTDEKLLFTAEL